MKGKLATGAHLSIRQSLMGCYCTHLTPVSFTRTLTSSTMTDEHTPADVFHTTTGQRDLEHSPTHPSTDFGVVSATQAWVRAGFNVAYSQSPDCQSPCRSGSDASVPNGDFGLFEDRGDSVGAPGAPLFGSSSSSIQGLSPLSVGGYPDPQSLFPALSRTFGQDERCASPLPQVDRSFPIGTHGDQESYAFGRRKRPLSDGGVGGTSSLRTFRQSSGPCFLPLDAALTSSSQSNPQQSSYEAVQVHHSTSSSMVPTSRVSMPPPDSRNSDDPRLRQEDGEGEETDFEIEGVQ